VCIVLVPFLMLHAVQQGALFGMGKRKALVREKEGMDSEYICVSGIHHL